MPAIQPARLKQQCALLALHFDDPEAFARSLHYLLDLYADRTHRPGQAGKPPPLIEAYHVPPPVLRLLLQALTSPAEADSAAALALCDRLWLENILEFRLLAAMLLGKIPLDQPQSIEARLLEWSSSGTDEVIEHSLLDAGVERMRRQAPERVLALSARWLESSKVLQQQLGLRILLPLIGDPEYQNLPLLFNLLQPWVRNAPAALRPDVQDAVAALARRSPRETAFFLRQSMQLPNSPGAAWMIRNTLEAFPLDVAENLRQAVRNFSA